jgi:ATP-binding cassette subfamily F protein uup
MSMSNLITFRGVRLGFRGPPLLDGIDGIIGDGKRIGLLGRNGAGKTSLLRLIAGELQPDAGEVVRAPNLRVAWLPQDIPEGLAGSVQQVVAGGWEAAGIPPDHEQPWQREQQVVRALAELQLDGTMAYEPLSAGLKRRVLLARALVIDPQLLLLDEPTNHLDLPAIEWLEQFLLRWDGSLLFVTHDRAFLRRLSTRILELDRGRLFDWSCDYDTFLQRKADALAAEEKQQALFDKRLAEEEAWIRRGISARRTRNEGRVRRLEQMRRERAARRNAPGRVQVELQTAERSGALVLEAKSVSYRWPSSDRVVIPSFSTRIHRGDKVGIIGPNGAGKTTLLRILLGELAPTTGEVRLGTNLQVAYFDQMRAKLDPEATVEMNVGNGATSVTIGDRKRHILGYLQDFLFSGERARSPVRFLSGGEQNRVLLAKLFTQPANVIVMDEPTNDLDEETLELLEELLVDFSGTVLIVSHDREFLNHVVSSVIAFEPSGLREYVGGYDDWLRQRPPPVAVPRAASSPGKPGCSQKASSDVPESSATAAATMRKRTFREQREYEQLPIQIEKIEQELAELHAAMAEPEFYRQAGEAIAHAQVEARDLETRLSMAYDRWAELDGLKG